MLFALDPMGKNKKTVLLGGSSIFFFYFCFSSPSRPDDDDDEEEVSLEDEDLPSEALNPHATRVYIGDVPSVSVIPSYIPASVQEEEEDGGMSDSDSEGPILYKEEEEEEEDDEEQTSKWLNAVLIVRSSLFVAHIFIYFLRQRAIFIDSICFE